MRQNFADTIFISHASPSDNYFTAWLSSKLKLLGYKVWVELDELKSGDAFWPEIENAIRNQSIKFLAIISKSYLEKVTNPISGVFKELSCADRIKDVSKFKSPIRIDETNEDDFPVQLMGLNSIDFYDNWQSGLDKLIDSFQKENLPRDQSINENPLTFWLDSFKINERVSADSERVYTNWFPIQLPEKLYIHKPAIRNKIDLVDIPFSYLEYSDRHLCFFPASDYPVSIECLSSTSLDLQYLLNEQVVPIDDFLSLSEPRKKIVHLLNKVIGNFFIQMHMKKYSQANTSVFYFQNTSENRKRVSLKSLGKTNVAVTGKTKSNSWSFGISAYAILYPEPFFKINGHIIFENQEQVVFGPEEHHALRRKFAFDWYNRDWLDTLLGMTIKLTPNGNGDKILVPINREQDLVVNAIPFYMDTDFGYQEPANLDTNEE